MPERELNWVELHYVLDAVTEEIERTQQFIADVDPKRDDAQRAARDLEVLQRAKQKLEDPYAND
jgi:hypothetical protein